MPRPSPIRRPALALLVGLVLGTASCSDDAGTPSPVLPDSSERAFAFEVASSTLRWTARTAGGEVIARHADPGLLRDPSAFELVPFDPDPAVAPFLDIVELAEEGVYERHWQEYPAQSPFITGSPSPVRPYSFLVDGRWHHVTGVRSRETIQGGTRFRCSTTEGREAVVTFIAEGPRAVAITFELADPIGVDAVGDVFALEEDEDFVGGGMRTDRVWLRGGRVEVANHHQDLTDFGPDQLTGFPILEGLFQPAVEQVEKLSLPFFFSTGGYGIDVETEALARLNLGVEEETPDAASFVVAADRFTYRLLVGEEPKTLVEERARLYGTPPRPPDWAFAIVKWRDVYESEMDVLEDARRQRELGLPGGSLVLDNPWETAIGDLVVDESRFRGLDDLLAELRALDYRVLVWLSPFVTESSIHFAEGISRGYFVSDAAGEPILTPQQLIPENVALIDLTNPEAFDWFAENLRRSLLRYGFDGFKADRGEEALLREALYADGTDDDASHNRYAILYTEVILEGLRRYLDDVGRAPDDFLLYLRTGTARSQGILPVFWSGDPMSAGDFPLGLRSHVRAGTTTGFAGINAFGLDTGGYLQFLFPRNPVTFLRWVQFSALCPFMEVGGVGQHEPFEVDDPPFADAQPTLLEVYRRYATLHTELVPFFLAHAEEASRTGIPTLRHLYLERPDDPRVRDPALDLQFHVGRELLVAPVVPRTGAIFPFADEADLATVDERSIYLPAGTWFDFFNDERIEGPVDLVRRVPIEELPLFALGGSLIPMNARSPDPFPEGEGFGVDTLDDPDRLGIRWYPGPPGGLRLAGGGELAGDGTTLTYEGTPRTLAIVVGGTPVKAVEVDGIALDAARDLDALRATDAGWLSDADPSVPGRTLIRVRAGGATTVRLR